MVRLRKNREFVSPRAANKLKNLENTKRQLEVNDVFSIQHNKLLRTTNRQINQILGLEK
ncbi:hypothetical protein ACFL3T_01190 [Patescibacteria group bacterium]